MIKIFLLENCAILESIAGDFEIVAHIQKSLLRDDVHSKRTHIPPSIRHLGSWPEKTMKSARYLAMGGVI